MKENASHDEKTASAMSPEPDGTERQPPAKSSPFRTILRRSKWWLIGALAVLLLTVIFIELAVNLWGYPAWVRRKIENAIVPQGEGICIIGWIKGGPFTGFEAEDIILDRSTPVGKLHVEIPALELQLSTPQLFALKAKPSRVMVQNAKVSLYQNRFDAISFHSLNALLRLNSHDTLQGNVSAQTAGIHLLLNATLYNGTHLAEVFGESDLTPEEKAELAKRVRRALKSIQNELSLITFGPNDTFLQANVHGDLLEPDTISVQGEYGITDAIFRGIVIPKHRGHFQYANKFIRLSQLQLLLSPSEVIQGEMSFYLPTKELCLEANGCIFPATIVRLTNSPPGTIPEWLHFQSPIEFETTLNHSGDDWNDLQPSLHFSCKDMYIAKLQLCKCSGDLSLREQILRLDNAMAELDFRHRDVLQGEAAWNLSSRELSARLSGSANLPRILNDLELGSFLQTPLLDFHANTDFEATLAPSPLDWTQWALDGTIRQPQFRLDPLSFLDTKVDFSLHDGELSLSDVSSFLPLEEENILLAAKLHCPLAELFRTPSRASVDLHTWLSSQNGGSGEARPFLELTGTVHADLKENTIALENGHGTLLPHILCRQLALVLSLDPSCRLDWLQSEQPGVVDFAIPQWPLNNLALFQLQGKAHFDACEFQQIPLERLDAEFAVSGRDFQMTSFSMDAPRHNPQAKGCFKIRYSPFAILFDSLEYHGNPLFIKPFLMEPNAMALFQQIWEPFDWSDTPTGHFVFDRIEFRQLPAQRSWQFNLRGQGDASDFHYRKVKIPRAHCGIDLSLPDGEVHIQDIVLDSEDPDDPTRLTGEAHLRFANDIIGNFDLHFHEGELDILNLVSNVAEPLQPMLAPVSLSHQTYFDLHGNFVVGANPYLRLNGSIEAPWVKFYSLELQDLHAKWLATPQFIQWDCKNAEFFGGKLAATGEYNHSNSTGQCLFNIYDLPLKELIQVTSSIFHEHGAPEQSPEDKAKKQEALAIQPGLLDAEAKLSFFLNWADQPIHIEGNGQISIHQADLWHIPLLTSLGNIISVGTFNFFSSDKIARLGTISRLKATVECQGNRIFIPEFKTDGTVVALAGSGEYDLRKNQMDFLISGQFLKNFSIINWILTPLSWAFKAELVGTPGDYEWHLRSGWRKLEDKDN